MIPVTHIHAERLDHVLPEIVRKITRLGNPTCFRLRIVFKSEILTIVT